MKKKITVISLILLFVISTIGLPLSINICTMLGTSQINLCKMNSGCENEPCQGSLNSGLTKEDCCKTELIDKSICDKYIQENVQKPIQVQNILLILNPDIPIENNLCLNSAKYFNDTSPPSSLNNHIYLNNSILLI
jgi:hypothetical protein